MICYIHDFNCKFYTYCCIFYAIFNTRLNNLGNNERTIMHNSKQFAILYHAKCSDGFGAAYSAWKYFKDEALYIPVTHGDDPPQLPKSVKFLYILDFSYPRETLQRLASEFTKVTVLDHHKTAQEALQGLSGPNLEIIFDMSKSGALLAWEYFQTSIPTPRLIKHISDRDLWKFELEGSMEVHMAMLSRPMNFKVWDSFDVDTLIAEGKLLLGMHKMLVNRICDKSFIRKIAGHEVPVVNTSIAWSEVGNRLLELYPDKPFAVSFTVEENSIMYSLRSREDFDVGAVAKQFGGGGHKQAAGFKHKELL